MKETDTQNLEEIDIDDIGTILKSSRLKSKKSLEEISSELCIRKIYLTALEESNYEVLPPIPYGIGYVRTYARYLGLSPERAVKLYKTAALAVEEQKNEEEVVETPEVNKSGSWHILVGILALAAIYGGWSWYMSQTAPKTSEETVIAITTPENESSVSDEMVTETEATLEQDSLRLEENNLPIVTSEEITQTVVDVEAPVEQNIEPVVEEAPVVIQNNVVLEFTGETWVELKDKNKVYFQGVFHNGDKKEIEYTDNLFLSVGRPGNVKVFIKGVEKDIVAPRRKMNIPLDSLN
ncbi:MAG: DUF4115 domain-containing protein [Alphaproteobacteria bacterium]|nr:DUF4115 domain-containing protein [Alphaproteobacteria bacterium]